MWNIALVGGWNFDRQSWRKEKVEATNGHIRLGSLVLEIVLVTFALSHVFITKIKSYE
jgi:hypothetical protein